MNQITIRGSVGLKGKNLAPDIKTIQTTLNKVLELIKPTQKLSVDGSLGRTPEKSKTVAAIIAFQKKVAGMFNPDGRIDPGGKTIDILKNKAAKSAPVTVNNKATVTYSSSIPTSKQLVSDYSKNVIKLALSEAGMTKAVITSTLRTPSEQAAIMYKNAKINLMAQFRLYGSNGDAVLKVYKKNSTKKQTEVIDLMTDKIEALLKSGKRTSKHCVTDATYKTLNIIDIGVNSTRAASGSSFNLDKFTKALNNLQTKGYIEKVIDETKKSNTCWHIEIKPNKKPITN